MFIHNNLFSQIKESTPSACWEKIYRRIRKSEDRNCNGFIADGEVERFYESGSDMFGFSNPKVMKLIKVFFSFNILHLNLGKLLIFIIGVSFASYFMVVFSQQLNLFCW